MLATPSYMSSAHNAFLPPIPSPLSPRSANVYGRHNAYAQFGVMASTSDGSGEKENASVAVSGNGKVGEEGFVPYSKRNVKKAPSPRTDELRERRRGAFLRRVREGRDEGRWESRGEDIMRLEYMRRQKAWEAELASQAPLIPSDPIEPEDEDVGGQVATQGWAELPGSSENAMQISVPPTQQPLAEDEVDEVLQREDEELEALLSYMPTDGGVVADLNQDDEQRSEHLWSDNDDYDALFSEFMEQDAMASQQVQGQDNEVPVASQGGGEAMDMS